MHRAVHTAYDRRLWKNTICGRDATLTHMSGTEEEEEGGKYVAKLYFFLFCFKSFYCNLKWNTATYLATKSSLHLCEELTNATLWRKLGWTFRQNIINNAKCGATFHVLPFSPSMARLPIECISRDLDVNMRTDRQTIFLFFVLSCKGISTRFATCLSSRSILICWTCLAFSIVILIVDYGRYRSELLISYNCHVLLGFIS